MPYLKHLDPISSDLKKMDAFIAQRAQTDIQSLNNMCQYLFSSEGKRIRPSIVLLTAKACNATITQDHIKLAAVIELIHAATLLHDDVIDTSEKRRGKTSHHMIWGNQQAILLGDYVYSLAFNLIAEIKNTDITQILAQASCEIVQSELIQSSFRNTPSMNEESYFKIIHGKTATLFSAAMETSALLSNSNESASWKQLGLDLGAAYQLIDDCLDYQPNNTLLNKNPGDDCFNGTPTLPLIKALTNSSDSEKVEILSLIDQKTPESFNKLCSHTNLKKGIKYTQDIAKTHHKNFNTQLTQLADQPHHLIELADFLLSRLH